MNTIKGSWQEFLALGLYFVVIIGVGIYFFLKERKNADSGEKSYFLGGRNMGGWVAALSAGASDMSAWVLMGLPGSIYLAGLGKVWISVGLLIGTVVSWIYVAPRLRRYSIIAGDAITIPQFLTNRFLSANKSLQVVSAIVFVVAYCIYSASSLVACGKLFNTMLGVNPQTAMIVAACVIVFYTFLGGFNAVCWTDFFQGLLMLAALMIAPLGAVAIMVAPEFIHPAGSSPSLGFFSFFPGQGSWSDLPIVLSGLGWGLGYFGMPHILVRYLSIKSEKAMSTSRVVGCTWTAIILFMASVVGITGRYFVGDALAGSGNELIFVTMVRAVFPLFIGGILLSAILAAAMSTADSQLLASSSAFASDVYKPVLRKKASDLEMLWIGRFAVLLICVIAFLIANSPSCGGIMALVECAWGAFGASFGPAILLALFWKRFTYAGAVAGITVGFLADALWYLFLSKQTGLFEIVPGFAAGLIAAVIVSWLMPAPSAQVLSLFERAKKPVEKETPEK